MKHILISICSEFEDDGTSSSDSHLVSVKDDTIYDIEFGMKLLTDVILRYPPVIHDDEDAIDPLHLTVDACFDNILRYTGTYLSDSFKLTATLLLATPEIITNISADDCKGSFDYRIITCGT